MWQSCRCCCLEMAAPVHNPASVHSPEVASHRVMDCYSCLPALGVDTACSGVETSPTANPGLSDEGHPRAPGWFSAAEEEGSPHLPLLHLYIPVSAPDQPHRDILRAAG